MDNLSLSFRTFVVFGLDINIRNDMRQIFFVIVFYDNTVNYVSNKIRRFNNFETIQQQIEVKMSFSLSSFQISRDEHLFVRFQLFCQSERVSDARCDE